MARAANCPANTGGPSNGQRAPAALLKPDGSDRRGAGEGSKGEDKGGTPENEKNGLGAPMLGLGAGLNFFDFLFPSHTREDFCYIAA